jgi:hypothetical protein
MRTRYFFHPNTCCLFDCIVRTCTCKTKAVKGPTVKDRDAAMQQADNAVGAMLDDDRVVMALRGVEESASGMEFHFLVE